ncbi:hypothetical protein NQ317_006382 [Molorchus minor]|uniref:Uncharacterized protein n=1 Tax=Molorchus minor TaxID=1323400 RepID=A0ABQ9JR05_9CUCU|nr:hypothetical protein NQ317_006382 [Molorchus minor]
MVDTNMVNEFYVENADFFSAEYRNIKTKRKYFVCVAAIFAAVNARPGGGYDHYELAGYGDGGSIGHYALESGYAEVGGLGGYGGNEIEHDNGVTRRNTSIITFWVPKN